MTDSMEHFEYMAIMGELYYEDILAIEKLWEEGYHITKNREKLKLKEMTTNHLRNTINYFKQLEYDISPLEKELKKRSLITHSK
jgi:hypothetical protein